MASRSLRNRSTIVDETIMPYLGSVKNSITTTSQVNPHTNVNTLQPTLNIESYHLARQGKASDPNFHPHQPVNQNDESGFIETEPSRHDFSYEKIETCRNPLTDDPVQEDMISREINIAPLSEQPRADEAQENSNTQNVDDSSHILRQMNITDLHIQQQEPPEASSNNHPLKPRKPRKQQYYCPVRKPPILYDQSLNKKSAKQLSKRRDNSELGMKSKSTSFDGRESTQASKAQKHSSTRNNSASRISASKLQKSQKLNMTEDLGQKMNLNETQKAIRKNESEAHFDRHNESQMVPPNEF